MIHTGDCIEVMAAMDADSVDAIVTDPPYGLAFMGKSWDTLTPQRFGAWCEAWGREALRVTKPGGYLLAFGGTRTHHRLVCGLEDAGWIIRDELDWIYASGFPKGKANLKPAHEPIVLARKPGPLQPLAIDGCRIGIPDGESVPRLNQPYIRKGDNNFGGGVDHRQGTVTGESSAGRWPSNVLLSEPALFDERNAEVVGSGATVETSKGITLQNAHPANDVYGEGMGHKSSGYTLTGYGDSGGYSRFFIVPKADRADREPVVRNGNGKDRENAHPTVKPVDLMRHLVRLVTPTGGTVLDPFLGSGSTAIAAELEGFPWVGIEKEPEYVAIAEARLHHTQRGLGL